MEAKRSPSSLRNSWKASILILFAFLLANGCSTGPSPEERIAQLVGDTTSMLGNEELQREVVAMGDDAVVPLFDQAARADQPSIEDVAKQKFIADLLKLSPPDKVKSVLRERLSSNNPGERMASLTLLLAGLHVNAFEGEVRTLISDPDPNLRRMGIGISRQLPAPAFQGEYEEGIVSDDPYVRLYSASGLVAAGNETGYSALEELLRHRDPQLVITAISELGKIGTMRARRILQAYRKEAPETMRPSVDYELSHWTRREPVNTK